MEHPAGGLPARGARRSPSSAERLDGACPRTSGWGAPPESAVVDGRGRATARDGSQPCPTPATPSPWVVHRAGWSSGPTTPTSTVSGLLALVAGADGRPGAQQRRPGCGERPPTFHPHGPWSSRLLEVALRPTRRGRLHRQPGSTERRRAFAAATVAGGPPYVRPGACGRRWRSARGTWRQVARRSRIALAVGVSTTGGARPRAWATTAGSCGSPTPSAWAATELEAAFARAPLQVGGTARERGHSRRASGLIRWGTRTFSRTPGLHGPGLPPRPGRGRVGDEAAFYPVAGGGSGARRSERSRRRHDHGHPPRARLDSTAADGLEQLLATIVVAGWPRALSGS